MSVFSAIRDAVLHPIGFAEKEFNTAKNYILPDNSAAQKAQQAQQQQLNDAINAYKEQTALTQKQLADAQAQTDATKRQVAEKQIRALRSTYRAQPAGILGIGQPATGDTSNQLGG